MKPKTSDIIIIGGGLTGLTIAYLLKETNYQIQIIEANSQLGGRINTVKADKFPPIEMGATWFGEKHTALKELISELDIDTFDQHIGDHALYEPNSISPPQLVQLPKNQEESSARIKDGTITIIDQLKNRLGSNTEIQINKQVKTIEQSDEYMIVGTDLQQFQSKYVISTLPPYLLLNSLRFTPNLPSSLIEVMRYTHTWMGESIKVGLSYEEPFWKNGLSGTIFSNVGPIPEMYDHSNFEENRYALKGFLNPEYHSATKDERIKLILNQLLRYYGDQAKNYLSYEEKIWRKAPLTYSSYKNEVYPHQNNGHSIYKEPVLGGRFYVAGSETASNHPGYM